jgi:hypothetical protein
MSPVYVGQIRLCQDSGKLYRILQVDGHNEIVWRYISSTRVFYHGNKDVIEMDDIGVEPLDIHMLGYDLEYLCVDEIFPTNNK